MHQFLQRHAEISKLMQLQLKNDRLYVSSYCLWDVFTGLMLWLAKYVKLVFLKFALLKKATTNACDCLEFKAKQIGVLQ